MRKLESFLFGVGIFLTGLSQTVQKVVFVIADGIPADVIEKLHPPHLYAIAGDGGFTRAHVGGERDGYSHFRFFKEQYPQRKMAVFSSWEDNRTKLVGEGLPATGGLKLDMHYDGLENDTANFPHDKPGNYMHLIDESVVDHAAEGIKTDAPDLSWVYLEYTDDIGHKYGDGAEFDKAVGMMDEQMGGKDDYVLMSTVPVAQQQAVIDVSRKAGAFYKIVIETPDNYLNRWITLN